MPSQTNTIPRYSEFGRELFQTLTAIGSTDPVKVAEEVAVQLTGPATAITGQVERSTKDPAGTPNWAPVGDPITGNPSTGIQVSGFYEPAVAWWRFRLTALTGASLDVSISGGGA